MLPRIFFLSPSEFRPRRPAAPALPVHSLAPKQPRNPPARQNPSPRSRAAPPGAQSAAPAPAIAARRIGGAYGVSSAPEAEIWAEETWLFEGGAGDGALAVGLGDPRGGAGPARGRGCRRSRRGGS